MLLRPFLAAAAAVLVLALPVDGRAERKHDGVTLTFLPSPAAVALCPEADYLENEVFVRLGYELFQPKGPMHLTVKIDRANGQFRAAGEMRDDEGKVLLTGTYAAMDCTFAVFSVAVAVCIQFTEQPEPPPPPPPPCPVVPPPPSPLPVPEPTPPPTPPAPPTASPPLPEPRRIQAGLASVFSFGAAPSVVGGVGGFVGVRWPSVSLALEGRALFAPSATLERATTVRDGYHFDFAAISGTGCYHPARWASVCARVEVGSLSFSNSAVDITPSRMPVLGLGGRVGGDWVLTPWLAIRSYVEVLAQPNPRSLGESPENHLIWSQPTMYGSVGLGPVFTLSGT
jgi:hypothetical protein